MRHARQDYNVIQAPFDMIPENEPVFLLRGKDPLAPELLLRWSAKLRLKGGDPKMAQMIENHAQEMIEYQKTLEIHLPDLPKDKVDYKIRIEEQFAPRTSHLYGGLYLSENPISLFVCTNTCDIGQEVIISKGSKIKIDNSVLSHKFDPLLDSDYEVNGIFRLDGNNASNTPIFTITKYVK